MVVSINPWLDADESIMAPSIAGTWVNTNKTQTASFVADVADRRYEWTLAVGTNNDTDKYECSLHSLGATLLLQIGPTDERTPSVGTLMPVYHLFRLELTNDTMQLYPMDRGSFQKRARRSALTMAEMPKPTRGGKNDKQYGEPIILCSQTETLKKFVAKNIKDKTFFSEDPWYSFSRVPTGETATARSAPQEEDGTGHGVVNKNKCN
jgi:hypothetical protein